MKKKKTILLVVLLMAVGFAAVSATLFINGTTKINANQDDFNVYYSDAYVNGVQDKSVITDDTHITFTTELSALGEKYVLDYEVTNGSKNYDAELEMVCTGGNDYLSVTNDFDDDTILKSNSQREGKLTLELTKSYAGDEDLSVTIECTINANALERDSLGIENRSEIGVTAIDENDKDLNAKAYEITGADEEKLLQLLVDSEYIDNVSEVDALIEVKSDEFENLATTTFDVSSIASEGDTVVILHFDEEKQMWEYISEETVDENGSVTADFTSFSPVAFVVVKEDGSYEKHDHNIIAGECSECDYNVPGLYDANGVMLASWEESGIDVGIDYSNTETDANYYKTTETAGYYVLTNKYPTTTKVIIPKGVTSIGERAFLDCINLTSVTLGTDVISIGSWAFYGTGITSIMIPANVTSIEKAAFAYTSIKDVVVDENNKIFKHENNTIIDVTTNTLVYGTENAIIPDGVTSIGPCAFEGVVNLTNIEIPDSVTSIGEYAFSGTSITSVVIPGNVTSIGSSAFLGCSNLTSVTIEKGVTSIGYAAFYECSNLTSVVIPDSVTSIGSWAFSGTNITSVVIPDNLTSIGDLVFYKCPNLTSITWKGTKYTDKTTFNNALKNAGIFTDTYGVWY